MTENLETKAISKTAIELIHIALINEAKNRLRKKDKTVSEIAFDLGFENMSYFSPAL